MSSPTSSFGPSDVLPWAGACVTALVGWFAARHTSFALLSKTNLDASRALVEEYQRIHSLDTARILELESEVIRQRGEINQQVQKGQSLQRQVDHWRGRVDKEP